MLFNQFLFNRLYSARFVFDKDGGAAGAGGQGEDNTGSGGDAGDGTTEDEGQQDDNTSTETEEGGETPQSYQALYDSLPAEHRTLIDDEIGGLRSALSNERSGRKEDNTTLKRQLKELQKQLEEGTEARVSLDGIIGERDKVNEQLDLETERSEFFLDAHNSGVLNLKLAWLAVQEERVNKESEMFDKKGRVDFDILKEQHPQLFAQEKPTTTARTRAGSGHGSSEARPKRDMNFMIRRGAGRT